jgi:hypothetical protein
MKTKLILPLLLMALYSCKKDALSPVKNDLAGSWELKSSSTYSGNYFYPPGNGKIIILGNDDSFQRKNHDTLVFKGQYSLTNKKDCSGTEWKYFFKTSEPGAGELILSQLHDTLTLSTSNCVSDGAVSKYTRY